MPTNQNYTIYKGKTFNRVIRWEESPFVYKAITAVTQAAPVRLTVTSHGIPDGWRFKVESVKGMTQLNSDSWYTATVVDPDTIEINEVNSLDFKPYTSGGVIKYYTPVSMTGFTARMTIKDKFGGTVIASTEVAHAPLNTITATVDDIAKVIELDIPAAATAALTNKKGVYDLELVSPTAVVTGLLYGNIEIKDEVTT